MSNPLEFAVGAVKEAGSLHFAGRVDPGAYQESLSHGGTIVSPLDVEIDLTARGAEIDCLGRVRGKWALECCRCLAHPEVPFSAEVEGVLPAAGDVVDASEEIRQALALALPYRYFCKPDCKGLCPRCKKNQNLGACACACAKEDLKN